MTKEKWNCPNGCKMECVRVEAKEIWYNQKGRCEIDDLEGRYTSYDGGYGDDICLAFWCPVCNQILDTRVYY